MFHRTQYTNNSSPVQNMISVRCVYDDWYWGSDPIDTKDFRWGDVNRASYAPPMNH